MTVATVVVCAHNEENYIEACLRSILRQTLSPGLVILVADRCVDRTVELSRQQLARAKSFIIEKEQTFWKNSISENLQMALDRAIGTAFVVTDADMLLPPDFLETLLPQLDNYASVSGLVRTDPTRSFLNALVAAWEKTYLISPLGQQPRGGARAISLEALRSVQGFRDVYAWESDLDTRLRKVGLKVKLERKIAVLHRRKMTIRHSVSYQIQAGRARKELGVSLVRTLLHSLVRLRPFVIYGYITS